MSLVKVRPVLVDAGGSLLQSMSAAAAEKVQAAQPDNINACILFI
jgi:hypothetical protein